MQCTQKMHTDRGGQSETTLEASVRDTHIQICAQNTVRSGECVRDTTANQNRLNSLRATQRVKRVRRRRGPIRSQIWFKPTIATHLNVVHAIRADQSRRGKNFYHQSSRRARPAYKANKIKHVTEICYVFFAIFGYKLGARPN